MVKVGADYKLTPQLQPNEKGSLFNTEADSVEFYSAISGVPTEKLKELLKDLEQPKKETVKKETKKVSNKKS